MLMNDPSVTRLKEGNLPEGHPALQQWMLLAPLGRQIPALFLPALFLPAARAVPAVGARASRWAGAFQNVLDRPCGRERGWALRSPRAWVRQLWAVRSSREALRNAGTPRILLVLRCRQVLLTVIVSAVNLTQRNALSSSCGNIISWCGMKDAPECWGKKVQNFLSDSECCTCALGRAGWGCIGRNWRPPSSAVLPLEVQN